MLERKYSVIFAMFYQIRQQRNNCNLTADYGSSVLSTLYVYEHRLLLELIRDREFTVGCWEIVDILINADVE